MSGVEMIARLICFAFGRCSKKQSVVDGGAQVDGGRRRMRLLSLDDLPRNSLRLMPDQAVERFRIEGGNQYEPDPCTPQPSLHLRVRQGQAECLSVLGPPHLTGWLILEGDDWVTGSIDVPPQATLPQVLQRLEQAF